VLTSSVKLVAVPGLFDKSLSLQPLHIFSLLLNLVKPPFFSGLQHAACLALIWQV
jgi:hypothetical protein